MFDFITETKKLPNIFHAILSYITQLLLRKNLVIFLFINFLLLALLHQLIFRLHH